MGFSIIDRVLAALRSTKFKPKSFMMQTQNVSIPAFAGSGVDLIITDYSRDGNDATAWTAKEVSSMRGPNNAKVVSYLSVGECESYRFYSPRPGTKKPSWYGTPNPNWPDNSSVAFWDSGWKKILYAYLDRIIAAKFDGIMLDVVDAYESDYSHMMDMADLIVDLAAYARARNPYFLIIPNGGEHLYSVSKPYAACVSAQLKESVFLAEPEGRGNRDQDIIGTLYDLEKIHSDGKAVLLIEYVTKKFGASLAADTIKSRARSLGYPIVMTTDKELATPIRSFPLEGGKAGY